MAGQAIPEFKDGYPDDAFVISAATQSTEAADTVLFIAPRDVVVLACDFGYDTDADATCAFTLRRVPSSIDAAAADTATSATGTTLSNSVDANGTGNNKVHSLTITETENIISKGERLVLRGAAGSALTGLHATVVLRPYHVSNA